MLRAPRVSDVSHSIPARTAVSRQLVVPTEPGPLLELTRSDEGPRRDELDEAFDELFGPDQAGSPGWFDALLVVGGLCLAAWGWLQLDSTGVIVVGAAAAALGCVLPLRAASRRAHQAREAHQRAAVLARGRVLDAAHPATAALVAAYAALLEATTPGATPRGVEARSAGHAAVVEAASLLEGAPPETAAQVQYVERRVEA